MIFKEKFADDEPKRIKLRINFASLSLTTHVIVMNAIDFTDGEPLGQWSRVARNMTKQAALPDAVLLACSDCRRRWPEYIVNPLFVNTEVGHGAEIRSDGNAARKLRT